MSLLVGLRAPSRSPGQRRTWDRSGSMDSKVGRAARQPVWLGDSMSINRVAAPRNQGDRSAEELHR